jgi:hypothetical protein
MQPRRGRARRAIAGVAEAVPRRRRQRLDGEHDARQLAAGDDPRQRPQVFSRIRRQEKLALVDTARGPQRLGDWPVRQSHLEPGLFHGQVAEQLDERDAQTSLPLDAARPKHSELP